MNYKTNKSCKLNERCTYCDCDACERIKKILNNAICSRCEMNCSLYPEVDCVEDRDRLYCELAKETAELAFVDIVKELI